MFTGLIEEQGTVKRAASDRLEIEADKVQADLKIGDSISINGVCLTVSELRDKTFFVDVMPQTRAKTTIGELAPGAKVNLERALLASSRLGGHFVTGHIDEVGLIIGRSDQENAVILEIKAPLKVLDCLVDQGAVAVDGVSLTIQALGRESFRVGIIPHTAQVTTLGNCRIGSKVNIEVDVLGKYIQRFLALKKDRKAAWTNLLNIDEIKEGG